MNQRQAFKETLELAEERGMQYVDRLMPSTTYQHLVDMDSRINDQMSEAKVGRWLGWAQCAVVAAGCATLEEMKQINFRNND